MRISPNLGIINPVLGMIKPTMGTKNSPTAANATPSGQRLSLADALFSSTQQRVLGLLFGQPGRSFYANEIIALVNGGTGAIQRELGRLAQSELVTVRQSGNQKHYQANSSAPIYAELHGIVQKTMGLADPLRAALLPMADRIHAAFVYGSVAKRQDTASSDVDVMILSDDLSYADVFGSLEVLSQTLGRTINPSIYTLAEWTQRAKRDDGFAKRVLQQPKLWLIGDEHVLSV